MKLLPPDKEYKDKKYVGYFENDVLVAVMDLILDYPKERVAYIGFFMMNDKYQGKGIGTQIIDDCTAYLKELKYQKIRLAIDKGNPQSEAFWKKNNFRKTGKEADAETSGYVLMEQEI